MASFNKVILMGNLTRDPELRVTPKGSAVCQIGLAMNESYTSADGQKMESVTFVDVDCFGKTAETVAKYFTKGRPILLEGRLKLDTWESKEGDKRSKLKVIMEKFSFVGGRDDGEERAPATQRAAPPAPAQAQRPKATRTADIDEEDVPF